MSVPFLGTNESVSLELTVSLTEIKDGVPHAARLSAAISIEDFRYYP